MGRKEKIDLAANQLPNYARSVEGEEEKSVTTSSGTPISEQNASLTVGHRGPGLWQDWYLLDELSHFTRERIPERVVHAKGAGAYGVFEVTHDITRYSAAKVFSYIGKKTSMFVRFSQVFGERGYADTVRDIRGFALKFYTEDGIWDLLGNNTPIFFIRDSILFPSAIHVMKRNPETNLRDWNMFWDYMSLRDESTHTILMLFTERELPKSYTTMHGYGANTFALVNEEGHVYYCKFHYKTEQGIQNMDPEVAEKLASRDPDYLTRDLYNNIAAGNYPSWKFYIQVMTPEQAAKLPYDPFDVTKVWLHKEFPLIPVGKITLNKNPKNYFAEVEQAAFDVAHLVPGIEPSPDRMLQGRLFAYGDTHRYRLGINNQQIPVNASITHIDNYQRDGKSVKDNQGGAPNYHPNSFKGPQNDERAKALAPVFPVSGNAIRYDSGKEDNYTQARIFWNRVLSSKSKSYLIENLVATLKFATETIQERAIKNFNKVDEDLARRIRNKLQHENRTHVDI